MVYGARYVLNAQEIRSSIFWFGTLGDKWDCPGNWVPEALPIQAGQTIDSKLNCLWILGSSEEWGNQQGSSSLRKIRRGLNSGWWAGKGQQRFGESKKCDHQFSGAHLWPHISCGWFWWHTWTLLGVTYHDWHKIGHCCLCRFSFMTLWDGVQGARTIAHWFQELRHTSNMSRVKKETKQ